MFALKIALTLVLLFGFCSALPSVINCTFEEYHCNARKCITEFYQNLQNDPSAICVLQYHQAAACVGTVFYGCVENYLSQNESLKILNNVLTLVKLMCTEGSVDAIANPLISHSDVNITCSSNYSQKAGMCKKTLQQKFVANPSDTTLCSEYVKAKKCLKNLLLSECTFNSQDEEAINFQLDDYNPFCANNRDPGATGSGHCSDYQVVSTTAVATTLPCSKSDVISSKQLILFFLLAVYLVFI